MKKILLFVILTMCAGIGIAQPSLSSRISTLGTLNRTYYLYDTGFRRQNVMKHFRINDSLIHYDSIIAATVVSGHDLDATLTLGNSSDLDIEIVKNGIEGEFYTKHMYNGVQTIHNPSGGGSEYPVTFMGRVAGNNVLYLRDAFGYFGYMGAGTLTADRKVLLPDEGDGVGLDATLVLHTTEDPITVTDGTSVGTYDKNLVRIDDGVGDKVDIFPTYVEAEITAGTTTNKIKHHPTKLEYKYTNSVGSISKTTYLNFDRSSFTSGTQNLWMPSATGDTLAVKGDITAMGNFATADLTFTGNRYHNVYRYNVDIDSANQFTIQDTSGNYALNINDSANYANSLIYVSSRTDKVARISPSATYASRLFLQANATQNLGQFFAGSNQISLIQTASINTINIVTGNGVQLQLDSATKKVGVTHLGGLSSAPTISTGTGAGTGGTPSATVGSGSTDLSGYFVITTGTTCDPDANVITLTYNVPYATVPKGIIISPANKAARNLAVGQVPFTSQVFQTAAALILTSNSTPLADATDYAWYYTVIQ